MPQEDINQEKSEERREWEWQFMNENLKMCVVKSRTFFTFL